MDFDSFSLVISIITGIFTSAFVSLLFMYLTCKIQDHKLLMKCTLSYIYFKELIEHPEYDDEMYKYILNFLYKDVSELGVLLTSGLSRDILPIAERHIEYLKAIAVEVNKGKRADEYIQKSYKEYSDILRDYSEYKKHIVRRSFIEAICSKLGFSLLVVVVALVIIA